jgi:pentatricopeptide repeat protein
MIANKSIREAFSIVNSMKSGGILRNSVEDYGNA